MDEARTVLARLDRIVTLDREQAPARELIAELRALVVDAERWLRAEPEPGGAVEALARCRSAMELAERKEVALVVR